jgi:hypothetical protein
LGLNQFFLPDGGCIGNDTIVIADVLSYTAGTPVITPGGYWYLGWVFAMIYFLYNNGVEHNIMVGRNI